MRTNTLLRYLLLAVLTAGSIGSCTVSPAHDQEIHYIGPNISAVMYPVAIESHKDTLGLTCATWKPGCVISIEIREDLIGDDVMSKRVVVHELIHASGMCGHPWLDPSYFLYPMGLPFLPEHLGDGEREWLRRHDVRVSVHPVERLRPLAVWACDFLNREVGKSMYDVEP